MRWNRAGGRDEPRHRRRRGARAAAGLEALEGLDLDDYHLFHATRAELLERVGPTSEAVEAWATAIDLTTNDPERRYLTARRTAALGPP